MPIIPIPDIPFDGRNNLGVPQYNGLFQEAQKALGGFEDQGALNRFNEVHPAGGMPAPGGTGIGSRVYDFLQSIGFGTK